MEETLEYKGIEIKVNREEWAENPWEAWDGCVPLMYYSDRSLEDYSKGEIDDFLTGYLTYNQVKRHQRRILDLIGYDVEEFREDYPEDRTEMLKDDLLYNWITDSLDNREAFCEEFGIKYYRGTSTGYSQSDWADLFLCWTPEFEKVTGRSYESIDESDFKDAFDLWGYWAYGDVYWYEFETEDFDDSCGGFYGDDFENNGLLEYARNAIDCHLENQKQKRQQQVKTFIKNKVPYQYREAAL